ncbi:hypothetical protein EB796_001845 [Bugula neritina]|uniref:Uncharacterized protein n=1 Tax=Bugula neritina TaxID=10212 RepID=A0A7J7KNY0_BUGNE|nr:hypothetical protein EB796_001845 [Bugula neritina]
MTHWPVDSLFFNLELKMKVKKVDTRSFLDSISLLRVCQWLIGASDTTCTRGKSLRTDVVDITTWRTTLIY